MPPFLQMLVIGLVVATLVSVAVYKYYDYREKKLETEHEKEMMETEHRLRTDEKLLFEDDIERELERD